MTTSRSSRTGQILAVFRRTPIGIISAVVIAVVVALAIIGPAVFGEAATRQDFRHTAEGPSAAHLLGTNALGQDILARTLAATRLSLLLALGATSLAALLGGVIGAQLAVAGPRSRRFGAGMIDAMMSFGGILLGIFIVAVIGAGAFEAMVAIALAFTPAFARFTYSVVASVGARDYVVAARVVGVDRRRLLTRYIFPNISDSLAIATFTTIAEILVAVSALSFLGLGVQYPQYEWGAMLAHGLQSFHITPWAALAPAIMITITGAAFAFFGDALARATNPLLWRHRPRRAGHTRTSDPTGPARSEVRA